MGRHESSVRSSFFCDVIPVVTLAYLHGEQVLIPMGYVLVEPSAGATRVREGLVSAY